MGAGRPLAACSRHDRPPLALVAARGDRCHPLVAAHLQEATDVGALAANEDRLHRCPHVVVDPAPARALEEGEATVVGVEHHLLAFARLRAHPGLSDQHRRSG